MTPSFVIVIPARYESQRLPGKALADIGGRPMIQFVLDALVEAGARTLPPGCAMCIGLGEGVLEAGEVAVSATNRNYPGRMGDAGAEGWLASPRAVAEAARIHPRAGGNAQRGALRVEADGRRHAVTVVAPPREEDHVVLLCMIEKDP